MNMDRSSSFSSSLVPRVRAAVGSTRLAALAVLGLCAAACGSSDDGKNGGGGGGGGGSGTSSYKTCEAGARAGYFWVELKKEANDLTGVVLDAPQTPIAQQVVRTAGLCRLMKPPAAQAPCTPACSSAQECVAGACKAKPAAQDVGKISVTGTKVGFDLDLVGKNYVKPTGIDVNLAPGAPLTLKAAGGSGVSAFTVESRGIDLLELPAGDLEVQRDKPTKLTWTKPTAATSTRMLINFSVNTHGLVNSWIECEVPDTGEYTMEAEMITALFDQGVSGFPRAELTRQAAGTTTVQSGCVELLVRSPATRDLKIPGYTSCSADADCPSGNTCNDIQLCE